MIPDGTYEAVVDRVEDGLATLELDDGTSRHELVVDPGDLPPPARRADAVLSVEIADGDLIDATYDEAATEDRAAAAQDRFDRLSRRLPRDGGGGDSNEGDGDADDGGGEDGGSEDRSEEVGERGDADTDETCE